MTDLQHPPKTAEDYIALGAQMMADEEAQRQKMRGKRFDTIAVHGIYNAQAAGQNQGSIIEPMYLSTSQHFENSGHMQAALAYEMPAWVYSRIANPTLHYLEQTLALMEGYGFDGKTSACVMASGMAAVFMATNPFLVNQAGEDNANMNIVTSAKLYGGAFMLFAERYANERGIEVRWVRDVMNPDAWAQKIDANTRFVYGEMPSNPALAVFDMPAVAELAHAVGAPLIVDSTVATPALMRPLQHGADIVLHSVSKTMSSSGFSIAGVVISRENITTRIGSDEMMRQDFATYLKLLPFRDHGPGLSPMNALLILNDLRTLRQKMDYFSTNTQKVAEFLEGHAAVERVNYPGLKSAESHEMASRFMTLVDSDDKRYGHLLSFNVRGGHAATRRFFDALDMIFRATDLGRIKSIATIPAISTHQQQGEDGRELAGIPDNQVRLSVGAEHADDIIDDLAQALSQV